MGAHVSYQGQNTSPSGALRKMSPRLRETGYCEKKERKGRDAVIHEEPLPLLHPWCRFTSQVRQHSPKFTFPNSSV